MLFSISRIEFIVLNGRTWNFFLDTTASSLYFVVDFTIDLPFHEKNLPFMPNCHPVISSSAFTTPRNARSRRHHTGRSFSTSNDCLRRRRLPIRRPYCITRARTVCGFAVSDSAAVWRPLSVPDLEIDPEVSADEEADYLGRRGCAGWVQPLSADPWPTDLPPSMAGCEPPISCPIGEITHRRIVATLRISWIFPRIAGAGDVGGAIGRRADGVSAAVTPMDLAICNRREKELHFLWRKYSLVESRSVICDLL